MVRADLHLHDEESRIPDERLGRLLGFSETWVTTQQQRDALASNAVPLLTVTNHNNARSCWKLLEAGHDVLPGAEFTCHFRKPELSIHVLTYGFTPEQEAHLSRLRHDALKFLSFCNERKLPTVLAHPLHFYARRGLAVDDFNLLYILFDRFEVINGQREPWSNLLALGWVRSFSAQKRAAVEKRFGLRQSDFCALEKKAFTAGSDDHFALYTGGTTTSLDVSDFPEQASLSERARLALYWGKTRPAGASARLETHALRLLMYLAQLVEYPAAPTFVEIGGREGEVGQKALAVCLALALRGIRASARLRQGARAVLSALDTSTPPPHTAAGFGTTHDDEDALAALRRSSGLPMEQKIEAQQAWARAFRRRLARDPFDEISTDAASVAAAATFLWRSRQSPLAAGLFAGLGYGATLAQRSGRGFGSRLAADIGLPPIDWQVSSRAAAAILERSEGDEAR